MRLGAFIAAAFVTLAVLVGGSSGCFSQTVAPNGTFTQAGSGAVRQGLSIKVGRRIDVGDFGVSTERANNATALQAAETYCASVGGTLQFPSGTILSGKITKLSNCSWHGQGPGQSILKAIGGVNGDFVVGERFAALAQTDSSAGITNFAIKDMTIDGNRAGQTTGACIAIFAFRYAFENLTVQNCMTYGIYSEWGSGNVIMEAYWSNVIVDTVGAHGVQFFGPHDSHFERLTIVDAGQNANNTYYGLYMGPKGNGRFFGFHGWHRGGITNRTAYQYYTTNGANTFSGSHFEGSNQAGAYVGGVYDTFDATNMFYNSWHDGSPSVIIAGNNNKVAGLATGSGGMPGLPPRFGIQLSGSGNQISMGVLTSTLGAIKFMPGEGLNQIQINASQSRGPGYAGTPNANDTFLFTNYGAATNGSVNQIPGLRNGATSYSGLASVDPAPLVGDQWIITDAVTCTAGLPVTAGNGAKRCPVMRGSAGWIAMVSN